MESNNEKKPLGVLILHGFTGSLDSVRALVPAVERLGLPWRMPVLRGHGTRYEDLSGVEPTHWYEDAEAALRDLLTEADKAVVIGLSMGGLVTLNLAMHHEGDLEGIVLLAPALRFADPLIGLTPVLKLLFPYWDSPNSFSDRECAKACTNYKKFPTVTFSKMLDYANATERMLPHVRVPALILHSKKDTIIHPIASKLVLERISHKDKRIVWYERSGHEMLQDCEAEAIVKVIEEHLEGLVTSRSVA